MNSAESAQTTLSLHGLTGGDSCEESLPTPPNFPTPSKLGSLFKAINLPYVTNYMFA